MAKRIDDNRLLPCPFCGEPAAIWYFPQHDRPLLKEAYYVGCTNDNCGCELEHPGAFKSLDDAVNAWNRRAKELIIKNDSSELEKNSKKLEKDFGELDCISREQALRELKESAEHHANDSREEELLRRDRDIIRALPSVTPQLSVPEVTVMAEWISKLTEECEVAYNKGYADGMKEQEPKTGEWIEHFDESGKWYECDQCHTDWGGAVNFCPNCGADMREAEE